jgi:tRNA U34 5-carboxymethylaminomethyl modifying GTPase MnmE/TrmE
VLEILDAAEPAGENLNHLHRGDHQSANGSDPALKRENQKWIRVLNKTDLYSERVTHLHASLEEGSLRNTEIEFMYDASRRRESSLHAMFPDPDLIFISAKTSKGIDHLRHALVNSVLQGKTIREGTVVTNARHHDALKQVASALDEIRAGLNNGLPGDLLSLDIRRALHYLGEITGEITNEEQLSWIFGKFCIGK